MKSTSERDSKSRHKLISFELTSRCNNACRHCYNVWLDRGRTPARRRGPTLAAHDLFGLLERVREEAPIEIVSLSGGEPLLHPELPKIVAGITDRGLQPLVITNGSLLTPALLRKLPPNVHFEVTLFSFRPEIHDRLAGAEVHAGILRNLSAVNRHGSHFTMVFVAARLNTLDIFKTVELGIALGARAVMFNRVNLGHGMEPIARELVPPVALLREGLAGLEEAVRRYGIQAACSVPIPPCVLDLAEFPRLRYGWCPRGGDNAYYTVGPDGFLRPCNHSSLILGDLRKKGFLDLISGERCRNFWSSMAEECASCAHPNREECGGGCPAAADEFYGPPRRMDPFCRLALE